MGDYSYSISDGMQRLNEISRRLLRGRTGEDENPLEAISVAKEVLQAHVNYERTRKETLQNGSDEEVTTMLISHFDDTKTASQIAAGAAGMSDEEKSTIDFLAKEEQLKERELGALLDDGLMSREDLASFSFDDDDIDNMQYAVDVLEDVENNILPLYSHHRRTSKNTQQQSKKFQPKSHTSAPKSSYDKLGRFKLPKLKVVEQLKAKRGIHGQRRLEEELAPQCRKKCDEEGSYLCNCQRLSECALELSWYDMAVRTLGGYVSINIC